MIIFLLLFGVSNSGLLAQRVRYYTEEGIEVMPVHIDPVTGDSLPVYCLPMQYVFNKKRFRNSKTYDNYWRMVNDVRKTLPIAKEARKLLVVAYDTCQNMSSREQRKYFKNLEKQLWVQYKPQLKKLNYRQGKLLVRLIDRECNKQSYQLIKDFLGGTRAFFWQSFGRLFGVSLKSEWEPDGKDKDLEDICLQIEHGLI
ncbi:MAG: DUF4294 domain-containing protein [Bacteroidales bacterium]|nr:DUF4294 domain-containing protein [Bacteroidales bacterium]